MSGDPFAVLLGVRTVKRPLNAYELMGLDDLEQDVDVIKRAVKNRRATLLTRKDKAQPLIWQKMSQELERAAATLTDPDKKAEYDEQLTGGGEAGEGARSGNGSAPPTPKSPLVGMQMDCPGCGSTNPTGRKFCGVCGHALREPCIECGGETFVGERFCGTCGANLEEACNRREKHAQIELTRAVQLCDEARYQEAELIIRPLSRLENSRLAALVQRSRELLDEIVNRRDQSKSRVDAAVAETIKALDSCRWRDAVDAMSGVPKLLRTKDHEELLQQATEALNELEYLNREIRASIKANQMIDLLPKVERVIELEPGNQRMLKLAEKLRRRRKHDAKTERARLVKEARAKLREFQYHEACELLEGLPEEVVNDEVEQLHEQLRELAYLWEVLRHSPVVDAPMLDIAERLRKLSPGDTKLAAVIAQLQERWAQKQQQPLASVPWAKPPAQTALSLPVRRLGSFGSIDVKEVVSQPMFAQNAPRLYAACGAALQGLGSAAIRTNLLPKSGAGMLGQLSSLVKRPKTGDAAWGIDLNASGLKAVRLIRRGDKVSVAAFDIVEHAAPLGGVVAETSRRDMMAETLDKFLKRNKLRDEVICLGFPGPLVLGRFFAVPPVEDKRLSDLMQYEARQQVPFPLEQLEWDHHIWYASEDASGPKIPSHSMLLAGKRYHVGQRLALFEDAGVRVHVLQSDCVALHNFYRFAMAPPERDDPGDCVMLLDVGADGTNFVFSSKDSLWFRSVPRGSDEFNKAVMRQFEASFATAEQLKRNPAKAKRISKLHEAWAPSFDLLLKDTGDSLEAFRTTDRRRPIQCIYALGGGFLTHGLHRHLVG